LRRAAPRQIRRFILAAAPGEDMTPVDRRPLANRLARDTDRLAMLCRLRRTDGDRARRGGGGQCWCGGGRHGILREMCRDRKTPAASRVPALRSLPPRVCAP